MHIAIDDTYGPEEQTESVYVTGARRTHVAVVFEDNSVDEIRGEIQNCLDRFAENLTMRPVEFHFSDIFNRRNVWKELPERANLGIFAAFSEIYTWYRWKILLQTIDEQIFIDHPQMYAIPRLDGLNPLNRSDLSLLWLCLKIRIALKPSKPPLRLLVDQGNCSPGTSFGGQIFCDWGDQFSGQYSASSKEPLIQIADFLAFTINRSTHLQMKKVRTETDNWFLDLVGKMDINCDDLMQTSLPEDFTVSDFDALHKHDRINKGYKEP